MPQRALPTLAALALALGALPQARAGFEFTGTKTLVAVTADGQRTAIGSVAFTPAEGDAASFRISFDSSVFTDHFLSMREFKCLPGATEITCHAPYPYRNPGTVRPSDLAWLEHSLLFLTKTPREFGARLWNGVYFEFRPRGSALVGLPKAVDLNEIAAPPADPTRPPFRKALRHDMPADARWLRELVIE